VGVSKPHVAKKPPSAWLESSDVSDSPGGPGLFGAGRLEHRRPSSRRHPRQWPRSAVGGQGRIHFFAVVPTRPEAS